MQFQVPQFIDVEPKIVGPLTLKQFLYIAGAAVPAFGLFFVLHFIPWIIITSVLAATALLLAFMKYNGQPMQRAALAIFNYLWQPRFFVWRRVEKAAKTPPAPKIQMSGNPLKDLLFKLSTSTKPLSKREGPSRALPFGMAGTEFESIRRVTGERQMVRRVDYR